MCGISGIFKMQGGESIDIESSVALMCQSLLDRGPDYHSTWMNHSVCFGHTRLAIMAPDDVNANQPMQKGQWVLTFNGEIYNFKELRAELEAKEYRFLTDGDTEVLVQLLVEYGIHEALSKIVGIFAFCAYDINKNIAYLVRDRLGVKPIYYWRDQTTDMLWFASTPAAIVNASKKKWLLNRDSVFSFFHLGAPMATATFFNGINRLKPAEIQEVNVATQEVKSSYYWEPQLRTGNIEELVEQTILQEKESHVEAAVFLSGGIDSSLMTLILSDVKAFHLMSQEQQYAEYIAQKAGIDLRVRECLPDTNIDVLLKKYALSSGEASASSPISLLVSELLANSGYKVAFSANGADELFLGYPRTLTPELDPWNFPSLAYEKNSVTKESEQYYHIFRDEKAINIPGVDSGKYANNLYDIYGIRRLSDRFPPSAHHRWFELQTYVANDLNPTLDFSSMACGLEVRVPFLNHKLVERCLSANANELIKADYGRKYPLKKMLKKKGVSPALWSRGKLGFNMPAELMWNRKQRIDECLSLLHQKKLFNQEESSRFVRRDMQYLHSAARAFSVWAQVWIDSGKVEL